MNIDFGIQIKKHEHELGLLRPTIKGWGDAINQYCSSSYGEDVPYYYNERANISLLAAGAWRGGAVALEEYGTKKRALKKRRGADHASGRCDLFVLVRKQYEFQIEATQGWIRASSRDQTVKNLVARLVGRAFVEATRNTEGRGRVGCVFFTVSFQQQSFLITSVSLRVASKKKFK